MRTATMNPSQVRSYLARMAQKRQAALDAAMVLTAEAEQIATDVFAPLNLDPKQFLASKVVRGPSTRKGKGFLRQAILDMIKANNGSIHTKDAVAAFKKQGYGTSAYVTLSRMAQAGELVRVHEPGKQGANWSLPKTRKTAK